MAYVHLGYRAILAMLRTRAVPGGADAELPSVTLIIPAHNEEVVLEEKLENAMAIEYPREQRRQQRPDDRDRRPVCRSRRARTRLFPAARQGLGP